MQKLASRQESTQKRGKFKRVTKKSKQISSGIQNRRRRKIIW